MDKFHQALREYNELPDSISARSLVNAASQAYIDDLITANAYTGILEQTGAHYEAAGHILAAIRKGKGLL